MDDEVFVDVKYEPRDFVGARRLALLTRVREANTPQIVGLVGIGAVVALFLAPDPVGRIFMSIAGAFIGLVVILILWGLLRASRPMPVPFAEAGFEISDTGVVVKAKDNYARIGWKSFDGVVEGMGVFFCMGKTGVILPKRVMNDDQIAIMRAFMRSHAGSS
jgi:hypothetical protein